MIYIFAGLKYYQFSFLGFNYTTPTTQDLTWKARENINIIFFKLKKPTKKKHSKRINSICSSNVRRIDSQWHQREQNRLCMFYKDMRINSLMSTKSPKSIFMTKS